MGEDDNAEEKKEGVPTEDTSLVAQPEFGEAHKYDPTFNGPIKNRSCTDVICCIMFLVFIVAFIIVGIWAFAMGDPRVLLYPSDSEGNICGYGDFENKPYVFFFDLLDCAKTGPAIIALGCPTPQICIEQCPSEFWSWQTHPLTAADDAAERGRMICLPGIDPLNTTKICVESCPSTYWQWYTLHSLEFDSRSYHSFGRSQMICLPGVNPVTSSKVCVEHCPNTTWNWMMSSVSDAEIRSSMICLPSVNAVTSEKICVQECPNSYFAWPEASSDPSLRKNLICKLGVDQTDTSKSVDALVEDEECAPYYMQSSPMVGRCVPTVIASLVDSATGMIEANGTAMVDKMGNQVNGTELESGVQYLAYFLNMKEYGMKIFQDVRAAWWLIIVFLVVGALVTFIWILLMRWLAAPIVWLTLICFVALFGFGTYYSFTKWVEMKDDPDHDGEFIFTTNLDYYTNLADTWLAFGIIAAIFLGVIILMILFLRKRILIAIALIKEASRAVGSMVFTLFWPLVPFLLQIVALGYWGASALFLASVGGKQFGESNITFVNTTDSSGVVHTQKIITEVISSVPCDPKANGTAGDVCSFIKYGGDYTIYLQVFQLFMWFWIMNFIVALGQMTLAGAFASYYWAFKKPKDLPTFPVASSLWRSLRYHMGSLAFGALIIAIIQMIRVALEYVDHKLKGTENVVAKFLMKCLKCCFWCLEKFMKFINKNAYIMIAIYGENFCTSAKNAFMLIMRNIVRVAVIDKVTDFLIFVGKLMVTAAITILSFYFFSGDLSNQIPWANISDYVDSYVPTLNYYLLPCIIIGIATFIIASGFFSVYSMGVDTLFLCFLLDMEKNDGSLQRPYYANIELLNLLSKSNRLDNVEKKKKKKIKKTKKKYVIADEAMEDLERNDGSPDKPYYMNKELMEILGKKNIPPAVLICCDLQAVRYSRLFDILTIIISKIHKYFNPIGQGCP
ncbi:hypothetical protein CAPTEDRAFT_224558 [Capitella teleta]|uniref:Uncharacterized protein n=1 Tax=Capitella teleta TaxID=283909 RepID=R7VA43_CAPTE|nr:hypothetical protein CAPTEDRAFT_224558 [Capitella teleta]|eukprot:ELU15407.1 hypothetical protein CAPTEDRAFT_224558 [Capitella teleta]